MRSPAFSVDSSHPKTQNSSAPIPESGHQVFRGVFHVHTRFSGLRDSKASLETVIRKAQKANLDFVIVTDHNTLAGAAAYRKMKTPARPILFFGDEISTRDGHLIALGISEEPPKKLSSQALVDWIHQKHGSAILAHPFSPRTPWSNWDIRDFDGFEIYNFAHAVYFQNKIK